MIGSEWLPLIEFARLKGVKYHTAYCWCKRGIKRGTKRIKMNHKSEGQLIFVRMADYEAWQQAIDAPPSQDAVVPKPRETPKEIDQALDRMGY